MHIDTMRFSIFIALVASAACRQAPTEEEYDHVATSVGALMGESGGGEAEAFKDSAAAARGIQPAGLAVSGMGSLRGTRAGLEYEFALECSDASGSSMRVCNEQTDFAHLVIHFAGDVDFPNWNASLARDGDWTLADITTELATLNGTGSFHADSTVTGIFRESSSSFDLDYGAEYTGVKIETATGRIASGAIHYELHANTARSAFGRDKERSLDITADVTFDGNGGASLVLDGDHAYRVELRGGATVRR